MKIAICVQDKHLEGVLFFLLERSFKVQVEVFESVVELKRALRQEEGGSQERVELLILEHSASSGLELQSSTREFGEIPRMVFEKGRIIGVHPTLSKQSTGGFPLAPSHFIAEIQKWVTQGVLSVELADSTQCRIRTDLLLDVAPLQGDIYVRLSADKFVRLFKRGDVFNHDDLVKYTLKKGIQYLYIPRAECAEFAHNYAEMITHRVTDKKKSYSLVKAAEQTPLVLETIQQLTHEVGFSAENQRLLKAQMQLTLEVLRHSQNLGELIQDLIQQDSHYVGIHSTICAFIACRVANQLQWGSDWTYQKLILASFLHDLPILNEDLAAISSLQELDAMKSRFTSEELKCFKSHPDLAADQVRQMSEIPPDVDLILSQHHEKPDGSGFPRGIAHASIAPLSALFIIAHDLTTFLINSGGKMDLNLFLEDMRPVYYAGQFKKIIHELSKADAEVLF